MLDRRDFLAGLLTVPITAPYVVRSGILMPVRSLLKPIVETWLEVSHDGKKWIPLAWMKLRKGSKIDFAAAFPTFNNYKFHRVIVDKKYV